jgi:hypothetical protein
MDTGKQNFCISQSYMPHISSKQTILKSTVQDKCFSNQTESYLVFEATCLLLRQKHNQMERKWSIEYHVEKE